MHLTNNYQINRYDITPLIKPNQPRLLIHELFRCLQEQTEWGEMYNRRQRRQYDPTITQFKTKFWWTSTLVENVNVLWNVWKLTEISRFLAWYERMQDIYSENRNRRLVGLLALELLRTLTSSKINTWQVGALTWN